MREIPLTTVSMDVRPGGAWRATMFGGPGRREIRWTGQHREVAAPERLVFTVSDQTGDDRYEHVTVILTDLGDGRTEMRFEQRGHKRPDEYDHTKQGLGHLLRAARRASRRLDHSAMQLSCTRLEVQSYASIPGQPSFPRTRAPHRASAGSTSMGNTGRGRSWSDAGVTSRSRSARLRSWAVASVSVVDFETPALDEVGVRERGLL